MTLVDTLVQLGFVAVALAAIAVVWYLAGVFPRRR